MATNQYGVVQKHWLTAFSLSLFLGVLGVDRFYLGKVGTGILKLLTFGGFGVWALIDFILITTKSMRGVEWVGGGPEDKKKAVIIFGVALMIGLLFSVFGSSNVSKNNSQTSQESGSETSNNTVNSDVEEEKEEAGFGDGTHVVGEDVQPGTYRSGEASLCYWARLSGLGGELDDIIGNGNNGHAIVTIDASDAAFETSGCGRWLAVESTYPAEPATSFSDGTFVVGKHIAPGTYRADGDAEELCYWARLSNFSGAGIDGVTTNGNSPTVIEIAADDVGFTANGCGTWTIR